MNWLGKITIYKDILLEKKVSGIADTILNVIFLLSAVMILIYMMIENKLTSGNSFYIILIILSALGLIIFVPWLSFCRFFAGSLW